MSWTAPVKTFLLFLSLFIELSQAGMPPGSANEQTPTAQPSPPSYNPSGYYYMRNPLDVLTMDGPNEVNVIFGMEFIDKVRKIKNVCEWKEYLAEINLQQQRQELVRYKENMEELKDKKYFKELPLNEQDQVQDSVQTAYDNFLEEESKQEDKLASECNKALMKLENRRMADALNYAKMKMAMGIGPFATYVNLVDSYGTIVQNALTECLNTFANELLSRYYTMRMTPSEICMQVEVEVLLRFIQEFVVRASLLVTSYSDDEDLAPLASGSGSYEHPPPRLPESFPRPVFPVDLQPQEPDRTEQTHATKPDTDQELDKLNEPFDSDFGEPNHNYEPMPSPVSNEHTEQDVEYMSSAIVSHHAVYKPRPTKIPSHKSSNLVPEPSLVVDGGEDINGSKDSSHSQDNGLTGLEESVKPLRPAQPNARKGGRPDALARPAASAKPQRPAPFRRPGRPEDGINQRPTRPFSRPLYPDRKGTVVKQPLSSSSVFTEQPTTLSTLSIIEPSPSIDEFTSSQEQGHSTVIVMIVFGTAAAVLILAIIVLAVFIGITKYRTAKKGWTKLTEEEKVDLMKRSGYVNPTYQFFDRVTQ